MINQIINIFKKERLDLLRDRRTVFASLAFAIFGPLMLVVMLNFLANMAEDETQPSLVILGAENAPNLVRNLRGQGVDITIINENPVVEEILNTNDSYMIINPEYGKNLQAGQLAFVELFVNRANNQRNARAREVRRHILSYGTSIGNNRLLTLGVPPSLVTPIVVEMRDTSFAGAQAKTMSLMILIYFLMAPFFSSMSVSIDITAGERERKSLQTLLAQPVTPGSLIMGKWALAAAFGMFGTTISVLGGMFAIGVSPIEVLGLRLYMDFAIQLQLLLLLYPLCWLVAGAQVFVALTAKSYKEANAYLQILSIVPALSVVPIMLKGTNIDGAMAFAPVISHLQLAQGLLVNGQGDWGLIAITSILSIILGVVALFFAAKKLGTEKILSAA
jgi:sodium transport system permease protein